VRSTLPALVFDLDGTLSDPAVGIGRSLNHALRTSGFPPIAESQVSRYIGPPLDHTFRAITGTDSPEFVETLVGRHRQRYADVGYAEKVLYAGMRESIAGLAGRGLMLGGCASKRAHFAEKILQMFGLPCCRARPARRQRS